MGSAPDPQGRDLRGFMKAADLVGAKIEAIAAPDDYLHRFGKPLTWEAEELYSDGDEAHEALIRSYLNNPDCIMGLGSYELYERIFVVTDKGTLEVYFEDEDLYITVDSADRSVYAKNHDRYASFDVRKLFGSVKGDTITGYWVMDRKGKMRTTMTSTYSRTRSRASQNSALPSKADGV